MVLRKVGKSNPSPLSQTKCDTRRLAQISLWFDPKCFPPEKGKFPTIFVILFSCITVLPTPRRAKLTSSSSHWATSRNHSWQFLPSIHLAEICRTSSMQGRDAQSTHLTQVAAVMLPNKGTAGPYVSQGRISTWAGKASGRHAEFCIKDASLQQLTEASLTASDPCWQQPCQGWNWQISWGHTSRMVVSAPADAARWVLKWETCKEF